MKKVLCNECNKKMKILSVDNHDPSEWKREVKIKKPSVCRIIYRCTKKHLMTLTGKSRSSIVNKARSRRV